MCEKDVKKMHDKSLSANVSGAISAIPSREETLGSAVIDILRAGQSITRRTICLKLAAQLSTITDPAMEAHVGELISLLLKNKRPVE